MIVVSITAAERTFINDNSERESFFSNENFNFCSLYQVILRLELFVKGLFAA